jgi:uncharacterized surface protein with fasciclin (FAS1) repeats
MLKIVSDGSIRSFMSGKEVFFSDEKGGKSEVTIADGNQYNGVIHEIDAVLLSKS